MTINEIFKVIRVPFFIPDFNLLKLHYTILSLNCCIESVYINFILKQN